MFASPVFTMFARTVTSRRNTSLTSPMVGFGLPQYSGLAASRMN